MAKAHMRGHPVYYNWETKHWHYVDTDERANDNRSCILCKEMPIDGFDPCIGYIEGAVSACCGHGVETGYVVWNCGLNKLKRIPQIPTTLYVGGGFYKNDSKKEVKNEIWVRQMGMQYISEQLGY